MTPRQAHIAAALLNSYAHLYLGIPQSLVVVTAGPIAGERGRLLVVTRKNSAHAASFDEAKALIDALVVGTATALQTEGL